MMRDHECGVISIQTSVLRETILYKTDAVGRVICILPSLAIPNRH